MKNIFKNKVFRLNTIAIAMVVGILCLSAFVIKPKMPKGPIAIISYDMETLHFGEITDGVGDETGSKHYDEVMVAPVVTRQSVKFIVNSDGTEILEFTNETPKQKLNLPADPTPQDPSPQVKKTIVDGQKIKCFDARGGLIGELNADQKPEESALYKKIMDLRSQGMKPNEIATYLKNFQVGMLNQTDLQALIKNAPNNGGNVNSEDGYTIVDMEVNDPTMPKIAKVVYHINEKTNTLENMIYLDANGEILSHIDYIFKADNVLDKVQTVSYEISQTGSKITFYSIVTYENTNAIVN